MPKISVLMSVYNERKEDLIEAIDSILNQTYKNFELIIIGDNPESIELNNVIKNYIGEDSRVKFIINEMNIGLAESMNKAASQAKGEYYLRMDADDICDSSRLEKQYKVISKGEYDLVCSSYYFIDEMGNMLNKSAEWFDSHTLSKLLKRRNLIHHPTVIMTAKAFKKVGGYRNFKSAQDYDLWLRMRDQNFKFYMMKDKLLYYRVRSESITVKHRYGQATTIKYIKKIHNTKKKSYQDNYSYEEYLGYLSANCVNDSSINSEFLYYQELYKEAKKNFKKFKVYTGIVQFRKVMFKSKYYRPNIISAIITNVYKSILKTRYTFLEKREELNG